MKQTFLAALFLTCLLPLSGFAQGLYYDDACLGRVPGIAPNYESIATNDKAITINLERGGSAGERFFFRRNGELTYLLKHFKPSVLVGTDIPKFTVFHIFSPVCMSLAIPEQRSSNTVTTLYILDIKRLSSREMKINLLAPLKFNLSSVNKNFAAVCESNGNRFIRVNIKTGVISRDSAWKMVKSPCL